MPDANDCKPRLDELAQRLGAARAMGGPERLARQRRGGRLDARGRIDVLLDRGSFHELGALVGTGPHGSGAPADAFVMGLGAIDGRAVLVGAEDFTVQGGSIGIGAHAKRVRLARLARQERAPIALLLEGAGERASNALERYPIARVGIRPGPKNVDEGERQARGRVRLSRVRSRNSHECPHTSW